VATGEFRVVPYEEWQRDALRSVCLSAASERARTDALHARFTLLMYCDAYLERGIAYTLLDGSTRPVGYVLCAKDARAWRAAFEPWRQKIEELGGDYAERAAEELDFYESVADDFAAHLHIDIAEECTGRGAGRLLIETLLDRLRTEGVNGVVFGVAAANERAVGFYRHMGFEQLSEFSEGEGLTFCMRLSADRC
jgi:ribosomal protein S18 acetylase RimI-like enzyme